MNPLTLLVGIVVLLLVAFLVSRFASLRTTIHDYEVGLLFQSGRLRKTLGPGGYWILAPFSRVVVMDTRTRIVTVPAQEVLTSDSVSIKASLLLRYKIGRADLATNAAVAYDEVIYADAQLALREIVGGFAVEELVGKRDSVGGMLEERLKPKAESLGVILESAGLKDLVFPPPLRQAFHEIIEARKASQASLERARGEVATLRSLANAARMLENNPGLLALRTLDTISDGKHTVVLGGLGSLIPLAAGSQAGPASSPDETREDNG